VGPYTKKKTRRRRKIRTQYDAYVIKEIIVISYKRRIEFLFSFFFLFFFSYKDPRPGKNQVIADTLFDEFEASQSFDS